MHTKHPRKNQGGSRTATTNDSLAAFVALFAARFDRAALQRLWKRHQRQRRRSELAFPELLLALLYHVLMASGSLQEHVAELTGLALSGSALSQRRQRLQPALFEQILDLVLTRRADAKRQPHAFYKGLRLLGVDGTCFALTNTAQMLRGFRKAVSRRMKAAFAQLNVVVLVELGLHNPVAAAIGRAGESEWELGRRLLGSLGARDLLLADRLYGVQQVVGELLARAQFLVRVRSNLVVRIVEQLADGSALVEIVVKAADGKKQKQTLREVRGVVRGRGGKRTAVRLWTSLLDARKYPAAELLALYGQRWEVEITIKELKVEMRERAGDVLAAQTPVTAAQEVAALLLALAVLVEVRCEAAVRGEAGVLRISFRKTLRMVRVLWTMLELGEGIHTARQVGQLVARTMERIAGVVTPERRERSCPRAVRKPVGSWSRLVRRGWKGTPRRWHSMGMRGPGTRRQGRREDLWGWILGQRGRWCG